MNEDNTEISNLDQVVVSVDPREESEFYTDGEENLDEVDNADSDNESLREIENSYYT